jgi:hypothetical protein
MTSNIMLWVVPARVEGTWRVSLVGESDRPYTVTLKQKFQAVEGEAHQGGRRIELKTLQLEGNAIRFVLQPSGPRAAPREFRGVIDGDQMRGEAMVAQGAARWTAKRVVTAAQTR